MNLRKIVAASVCGGCLVSASLVTAQNQPAKEQPRTQQRQDQPAQGQPRAQQLQGQAGQRTQWQNSDHALATCVAIGNQEEIAIAKLAEERAKNPDVKEFAKMLVKDHQDFLQKLQRFAPEATREGYLMEREQKSTNDGQRTSAAQPRDKSTQIKVQPAGGEVNVAVGGIQQTSATQENAQGEQLDFVALHRELAENCLRSAKEKMNKKDGAKFDECFIGHQIVKHEEMKNKLTVFERHGSPELNQILAAGLEATEKHLNKAEEIMKKLADADSANTKQASAK